MIKLKRILPEQKGNERTTQVVVITPEAYSSHTAWTAWLTRRRTLSITKHTYPNGKLMSAARQLNAEADNVDVAVVQLIAGKEQFKGQITSVQALSTVCERKGIRLIIIGPETESSVDKKSEDYQRLMQWLNASNLDVIDISDLTNAAYYDNQTNNLNDAGNRVIAKRVLRYLGPASKEDSEEISSKEKEKAAKAAGRVKSAGEIAKNKFVKLKSGAIAIAPAARIRTGEATDWETVMDFLIEKGLSQAGAAGIAGNMRIESNFKPDVYGDKGTSVGIVQWHNTRMQGLFNFAEKMGAEPLAVDTQLEYLWHELTRSYASLTQSLKNASDPESAAEEFARVFERPAVISPKRMEYARQYHENYSTNKGGDEENGSWVGKSLKAVAGAIGLGGVASVKAPKTNAKNGQMSSGELKSVGGGHSLAHDAADAFLKMKADAAKEGVSIKLSDSYRPLSVQNAIFDWDLYKSSGKRAKKGTGGSVAAAYPGTSNHGLGRAIDVSNKSAQDWIRTNGEKYGWSWDEGRSVGEPWHFTYVK